MFAVFPYFVISLFFSFRADPYLNTDAGTMSPFEHGEVFVLDDGGEVEKLISCYIHALAFRYFQYLSEEKGTEKAGLLSVFTWCV